MFLVFLVRDPFVLGIIPHGSEFQNMMIGVGYNKRYDVVSPNGTLVQATQNGAPHVDRPKLWSRKVRTMDQEPRSLNRERHKYSSHTTPRIVYQASPIHLRHYLS